MAQRTDAPRASLGAWLTRFGFWCSIIAGVFVAALILGAGSLALFGGSPAQWLLIFLAVGPLIGLLLANAGTGLNYYGIWRVVRGLDEYSARDDALTQVAGTAGNLQGAPAAARAALGCGSLFSVGILGASLIMAMLSYLPEPLPHIGAGLPGGSPTTAVAQATSTPLPTPTTAPSPTPTQLPTATPSPTPSPTPIAFAINGASAVSPASFSGLCSSTRSFSINGTIFTPAGAPGGNVTYRWARSDGSFSSPQTINFAAGQTSRDVADSWTLQAAQGTGAKYTDQIQVSAPNFWFSTFAEFTFGCDFVAQSVTASVAPTVAICGDKKVVATGDITFSPSPGGTVTFYWVRDGESQQETQTFTLQPGATSATVTDTWTIPDQVFPGDHFDAVTLTAPNAITSNQVMFTYQGCD
jgi:hypothetical protein